MQMSFIGMFDLWTPAVPGEFPWPILWIGCCERPHVPLLQSRQAQYTPPLPTHTHIHTHWKGWPLNSQASGNICSPEIHTSCQLGSGWARGLGKDPLIQLWPAERADQEVLWSEEGGGGGSVGGGAVSQRRPYCVLKKRQGPYLSETAGGWWGANLLSGCVVGPLFPITC